MIFSELSLLAQQATELHRHAEEQRALQIEAGELPPGFPRPYLLWDELLGQAAPLSLVNLSNNDEAIGDWRLAIGDVSRNLQSPISNLQLSDKLFVPADLFGGQLKRLVEDIVGRLRDGEQVAVVTPQAARIQEMVEEAVQGSGFRVQGSEVPQANGPRTPNPEPRSLFVHGSLDEGWRAPDLNLTLYTDAEIFGWRQRRPVAERKRRRDRSAEERATFLRGLKPGDYVVHIEHGIAAYEGLVRRTVGDIEREYLNLRYAEGDRLYVPVDQVDRVSRYIGAGDAVPTLTRLGTQDWERAKRKARAAVQELANELLQLYAQRQLSEGYAFSPDSAWQRELEDAFPYIETDDQIRAIADVKRDMEQQQPMDRLICGDVGFGKTEVALRAAFKAVQDGKQVAVLVPTTVLAQQHYDTFSRRVAAFPVTVEMISRFRSAKEQEEIGRRLASGAIDIIIGTHRLLSKDIHFKDLGLLIVDEEQRFGVRHKERVKQMRANVDVLTLTATPIPRTLHMALAGIRDLSVIDTPPEDRVPIKTYVLPYDEHLVREAILRELDRGGQIYYVHNRVQSIYYVAEKLRRLVPEGEIAVGHGQLEEHQLEKVMLEFFSGKDDMLVCTTIIESGLDVPNANTLIIEDATHYGLAQLYQLRGRVGRSAQRAYAYLFYKPDHHMTPEAQERLLAIQEATELGAGFRIAMRDLEIRGAGNLLGAEQSGHIAAVGFDLYSRLLEQAVKTMKTQLVASNYRMPTTDQETGDRRQETGDTEPQEAARSSKQPSVVGRRSSVIDEKVLVAPLVTLDLPLDAYLPADYIADERVRLSVYQHMAEARTPRAVRDLRRELQDRFGKPPEPADHLLTWLLIKALALQANVTSIVTTDEEFIIRLPEGGAPEREKLRRRFDRDAAVRIGPQFARIDRRSLDGKWVEALTGLLETLAK
ncbi:MAG: transcription-repair coupling factor [Roseiflexaceae bacterium]